MGALGCPNELPYPPPLGQQTQVCSHTGQSATAKCETVRNVDEECVNKALQLGTLTGRWTPMNQCNTFANKVLKQCTIK